MADRVINLKGRGLRGESPADIARRLGLIASDASDADFIAYLAGLAGEADIETFPSSALTFQQAGTGAHAEFVQDALRRVLSLRQFCVGDGVADDTTGVRNGIATALALGLELDGHDGTYRCTDTIRLPWGATGLAWKNTNLLVDHAGYGISRDKSRDAIPNEYHGVNRCVFTNITLSTGSVASAGAWDCDQFQYCRFTGDRITGLPNTTHRFAIGRKYSNVAYWNEEYGTEIDNALVGWDLADYNDGRFYACKLVRFANAGITNVVRFSAGCSGVQFFGLSCETEFHDAVPIKFHADCEAIVFVGVRIEARSGSTNVLPIQFNGAKGNTLIGVYTLGAGITNYTDAVGDNELYYYTVGGMQRHMGAGLLHLPTGTVTPDTIAQILVNPSTGKIHVFTTSAKTLTLNPADSAQDMNGNPVTKVSSLRLQKNTASVGTDPNLSILRSNAGLFIDFENGNSRQLCSNSAKPTITGSRGGNAALASLLTALAGEGLITDSTSA